MRDIFDTHVHAKGSQYTSDELVKAMDANDVRRMCLIAPMLENKRREKLSGLPPEKQIAERVEDWDENIPTANDYVARMAKEKPDRILGLCMVDPVHPDSPVEVERAVEKGCVGLKLFNIGHYPWDERVFGVYEKAEELGIPILFHSGILGDGRNSRFHRPAEYEIIKCWPNLKVLLAHISWPWTDEAIATAGMGPIFEKKAQIYIDLTPGAPLAWREDAEKKAFDYLPDEIILFGTDNSSVSDYASRVIRDQDHIFDKLKISRERRHKFYWQNAMDFWGLKS